MILKVMISWICYIACYFLDIVEMNMKSIARTYRLVILMSVPDELAEKIIKQKVIKQIEEQILLKKNQHGFCKGKFCLVNLSILYQQACQYHINTAYFKKL